MTNTSNPFIFGGPVPPNEFFGRRHEVNFVLDRLYGHSRSNVAIWGDRRVGKTSLLHYIMQPSERAHWVDEPERHFMLFIDCQQFSMFSWQGFWETVFDEALLAAELRPQETTQPWLAQAEQLMAGEQLTERQVRLFFRRMQNQGYTLTLLLDEFTHLLELGMVDDPRGLQGLLNFLRTIITNVQSTSPYPRPLALVTSTRQSLDQLCQPIYAGKDVSRFDNPFVFERLKPFTTEDIQQLLVQKTTGTGVAFTADDVTRVVQTAGRHPLLVQAYAAELFDSKKQPKQDWRTTLMNNQFIRRNQQHFRDLWHYSTEAECQFLVQLLQNKLSKSLGSNERKVRNTLLERGLLTRDEGELRPFSELFTTWLRLNLEDLTDTLSEPKTDASVLPVLRRLLNERCSLSDIQTLCFDLNINYDGLSGDNLPMKILSLLDFADKRQRTADLLDWLQAQRPDLEL